jgi:hypothetical protein
VLQRSSGLAERTLCECEEWYDTDDERIRGWSCCVRGIYMVRAMRMRECGCIEDIMEYKGEFSDKAVIFDSLRGFVGYGCGYLLLPFLVGYHDAIQKPLCSTVNPFNKYVLKKRIEVQFLRINSTKIYW